ncbi:hypothetical protein BB558_006163 [Smittium angustum]|uniref:GST C-terminal domain-containing protein n=1 Tax=Smittium angustum TaxID=133377 RepID=A0A2U1IYI4_SMIAN|nr:hypothetical protein BB558_006163 [Smittium angustum]
MLWFVLLFVKCILGLLVSELIVPQFLLDCEFEDIFCPDEVKTDLKRIYKLQKPRRKQFLQTRNSVTLSESAQGNVNDEGFLFGEYGIVDAFFTSTVFRIVNYSLPCENEFAKKYIEATKNHSLVKEWIKLAVEENSYYEQNEEPKFQTS